MRAVRGRRTHQSHILTVHTHGHMILHCTHAQRAHIYAHICAHDTRAHNTHACSYCTPYHTHAHTRHMHTQCTHGHAHSSTHTCIHVHITHVCLHTHTHTPPPHSLLTLSRDAWEQGRVQILPQDQLWAAWGHVKCPHFTALCTWGLVFNHRPCPATGRSLAGRQDLPPRPPPHRVCCGCLGCR